MNSLTKATLTRNIFIQARRLSTAVAPVANKAPSTTVAAPASPKKSSSFFQRLSAFLVGCGVGFGSAFYYIHEELQESNTRFQKTLTDIQDRLAQIESN